MQFQARCQSTSDILELRWPTGRAIVDQYAYYQHVVAIDVVALANSSLCKYATFAWHHYVQWKELDGQGLSHVGVSSLCGRLGPAMGMW